LSADAFVFFGRELPEVGDQFLADGSAFADGAAEAVGDILGVAVSGDMLAEEHDGHLRIIWQPL
jgi:hypothetical protein